MFLTLIPPTKQRYISSTWAKSRAYRGEGKFHQGIDLPAPKGDPAYASGAGTVIHVDNESNSFAGKWIAIQHSGGLVTRYMHLNKIFVSEGQYVREGALIGEVGDTGTVSSSPHIHQNLKVSEKMLPEWERTFGRPTTGFGDKSSMGINVPLESIMSGAKYDSDSKEFSEARGVRFHKGIDWTTLLLLGAVGFAVYRTLRA
jgi:hypothetical protein